MTLRRLRRLALYALAAFGLVVLLAGLWLRSALRASLPRLEGQLMLAGLEHEVRIERDARGVGVLRADSLVDVLCAQGYYHAQERWFQMDLARRAVAGELAALLGEAALPIDREQRPLGMRAVAGELLERLPAHQRAWLDSYILGVNAGLEDLGGAPPEYLALRAEPEPWSAVDTLLVGFGIYQSQSFHRQFEAPLITMRASLPPELVGFLAPERTRWDRFVAPRTELVDPPGHEPWPLPGPDVVDLRTPGWSELAPAQVRRPWETAPGSNAFALAGWRSAHGGALLANDPHMAHRVPATWIRNELRWADRFAAGVTIPGVPGLGIGSNGDIAWGFTNAVLDQEDLTPLEIDPQNPERAQSEAGELALTRSIELLEVRGGDAVELEVVRTPLGPVVGEDALGRPLVYTWNVLSVERVNLELFELMLVEELEQALDVLAGWWGSSFNALVVDDEGRVGWTVTGYVPTRAVGRWAGALDESLRPRIVDPARGLLVSANQRPVAASEPLSRLWLAPDRARRIGALLEEGEEYVERDLLAVQLDEASVVHEDYARLLAEASVLVEASAEQVELLELAAAWDGRASTDSRAFRLLRRFRLRVHAALLGPLLAPCHALDPDFVYEWTLAEEVVARLLEERAPHLLPPPHASYAELFADALEVSLLELEREGGLQKTWGEDNRARFQHPLSLAVPALARWLDWPADPLPGSSSSVRASDPEWGAALRLVVSPGREADGILHVTGGQSGHFLSPHYADGHADWLAGAASPLLAGPPVHVLRLVPSTH